MSLKILLVDDRKIMRDSLRFLIEKESGLQVVAEAENGLYAVEQTRKFKPDVILMDIHMPGISGIEATRRIVEEFPGIKVIAISMHSSRQYVVEAIIAGASGYLLKDRTFEELAGSIFAVVENRLYLSPPVKEIVAKECEKEDVPAKVNRFCRLIGLTSPG
ncbi:MAG: response regulator transcription factor [Deltaproteobacteria bacterium]|jgi:DNA-binding NarL/FixJ family response regulator|nr:response regulator transcription factor [Deltaproteobacteria bacterium]MBW2479310.1 response regulator transcription factor [Deltaproteobacteria bacterium]